MTDSRPSLPAAGGTSGRPDPLAMPLAEKLACEWEARHDVMARGGRAGGAAALARYCTHARCEDVLHEHSEHHDHSEHARAPHEEHADAWNPLRSWLRWGEDAR